MGGVEAARLAGLETVPVLRLSHLTAEQKIGFALADNKIALNADWDVDQLKVPMAGVDWSGNQLRSGGHGV